MKALVLSMFLSLTVAVSARDSATVTARQANLRGTPSAKGKMVTKVKEYDEVEVIKQKGVWFLVQTKDFVGWLHEYTIRLNPPDVLGPVTPTVSTPQSDLEMKGIIEEGIRKLGVSGVTVVVENAEVTLTGTVPKMRLADVMRAVMEADVNHIINKLKVK
jgi:hypothetical protein